MPEDAGYQLTEEAQKKVLSKLVEDYSEASSARTAVEPSWRDAERQLYAKDRTETSTTSEPVKKEQGVTKRRSPEAFTNAASRTAFFMAVLTRRMPFLPLIANGTEDTKAAKAMELLDSWQFRQVDDESEIETAFMHMGAYGYFTLKCLFEEEVIYKKIPPTIRKLSDMMNSVMSIVGAGNGNKTPEYHRVVKKQYNVTYAVDPWNWWHDPNTPVARFHKGRYVIEQSQKSPSYLRSKSIKQGGPYYNVEALKSAPSYDGYGGARQEKNKANLPGANSVINEGSAWIREHYRMLTTEEEMEEWGMVGMEPGLWLFATANGGGTLIRSQRNPFMKSHDDYPYIVFIDLPNTIDAYPPGITNVGMPYYKDLDMLYNSHMEELQGVAIHQAVVNPKYVDPNKLKDNVSRGMVPLNPSVYDEDGAIEKAFRPIIYPFVTGGNITSAQVVKQQIRELVGTTDPIVGTTTEGDTTATEARIVSRSAGTKLEQQLARHIRQTVRRWVKIRTSNTVAYMSTPVAAAVVGDAPEELKAYMNMKAKTLSITPEMINPSGDVSYDVAFMDARRPIEEYRRARELFELVTAMQQFPELRTLYDPEKAVDNLIRELDFKNPEEFKRTKPSPEMIVSAVVQALAPLGQQAQAIAGQVLTAALMGPQQQGKEQQPNPAMGPKTILQDAGASEQSVPV